ncbi:MAG: hypothetical protein J6X02_02340 [Bacilli bacterium]|nr:hypothetical protein [Bacilli bacterium]
MDIVIIFIILIVAALVFKRVDNTIIAFGLIDVFLRIVNFIGNNTTRAINSIINKYLPSSIEAVIRNHTSGSLETIIVWLYILLMILFWYHVLRMLIHRLH